VPVKFVLLLPWGHLQSFLPQLREAIHSHIIILMMRPSLGCGKIRQRGPEIR
jgi:hypothetical protein